MCAQRGWQRVSSQKPPARRVVLPRAEVVEPGGIEVLARELHEVVGLVA